MSYAEPSFQNSWRFKLCEEFGPVIGVLPEILGVADDCTFVCVCVCTDIPLSVGILDPRASPTQLNAVEFLWDPSKRASAFIQVSRKEVACNSSQKNFSSPDSNPGVPNTVFWFYLVFILSWFLFGF